ncbi:MAG: transpeptidase family protein [Bacteroidales bacterium]|nr:transpeptidase family protein [Bacteroidales bacterium]
MNNKDSNRDDNKRMTRGMTALYLLLTLGVGAAIVGGMVKIQWVDGDEWRMRGERREADVRTDPARRGVIYSSDGKILATTVTECDLYLDLYNAPELDEFGHPKYDRQGRPLETGPITDTNFNLYLDSLCQLLADAMPAHDSAYYSNRILTERQKDKPRRCFLVERHVPYSVWLEIMRLPGWKPGVVRQVDGQSVIRQERAHIYGNMAKNTIGFQNQRDADTYTGLEGAYDSILRGQNGLFRCRRLTKGIWLPDRVPASGSVVPVRTDLDKVDTIMLQAKVDGRDIVSTIDTRYQDIAESSLRNALRRFGGSAGCAILMEMQTGYVLACANLAVDTAVHDYLEVRDRNVAVSDVYEPGSTFKTIILTAMLNDPAVKIDTAMMLKSGYKNFGGKYGEIKDDHTLAGRDSLNVREVIEQSSNVGMSDLGWRLYADRRDTLRMLVERMFPYGKLNPDVKAVEHSTYINNLHASNRDFLNFCYGYSTRISALQLITFYNGLGAEGRMVKPQFCKGVKVGDRLVENKPIVLNAHMCSRESALMMRKMLEGVVERGTGNNIKNNTYGIAGKTGTAVNNYANRHSYNASFCGFFPSENPRYTCLVVLERIPYYGRQAAEVFKSISDCVVAVDQRLSNGAVKSAWPTLEEDSAKAAQRPVVARGDQSEMRRLYKTLRQPFPSSDSVSRWVVYREGTDSTVGQYVPYVPVEGQVPNCQGMTAKDAVELLQEMGYKARVSGYGKVAGQQPRAGVAAKKGATVVLTLK